MKKQKPDDGFTTLTLPQTIRVDRKLMERIQTQANRERRTPANMVRVLIEDGLLAREPINVTH